MSPLGGESYNRPMKFLGLLLFGICAVSMNLQAQNNEVARRAQAARDAEKRKAYMKLLEKERAERERFAASPEAWVVPDPALWLDGECYVLQDGETQRWVRACKFIEAYETHYIQSQNRRYKLNSQDSGSDDHGAEGVRSGGPSAAARASARAQLDGAVSSQKSGPADAVVVNSYFTKDEFQKEGDDCVQVPKRPFLKCKFEEFPEFSFLIPNRFKEPDNCENVRVRPVSRLSWTAVDSAVRGVKEINESARQYVKQNGSQVSQVNSCNRLRGVSKLKNKADSI